MKYFVLGICYLIGRAIPQSIDGMVQKQRAMTSNLVQNGLPRYENLNCSVLPSQCLSLARSSPFPFEGRDLVSKLVDPSLTAVALKPHWNRFFFFSGVLEHRMRRKDPHGRTPRSTLRIHILQVSTKLGTSPRFHQGNSHQNSSELILARSKAQQ